MYVSSPLVTKPHSPLIETSHASENDIERVTDNSNQKKKALKYDKFGFEHHQIDEKGLMLLLYV